MNQSQTGTSMHASRTYSSREPCNNIAAAESKHLGQIEVLFQSVEFQKDNSARILRESKWTDWIIGSTYHD